ncbi:hypothetical protein BTUL_0042g00580 [Botrytis tulipae]|uniref:Uncharacterized protein n=1 Tax=Botrytis tulipae TaxID=87230 RepID=A0A4Z1F2D8_9HELO|nr:hypothetical protein BTUL_0042g00580 [Botrytis tulipae]
MCCCFGSRGEHVEPVKKISQQEFDEKKKLYESSSHRSFVPSDLHRRDPSRGSSTSRNGNRGSQSGSGGIRDSRGYSSSGDSHRYSNGGYGQEGYSQGGRSQLSLGTRALGSGLGSTSREFSMIFGRGEKAKKTCPEEKIQCRTSICDTSIRIFETLSGTSHHTTHHPPLNSIV